MKVITVCLLMSCVWKEATESHCLRGDFYDVNFSEMHFTANKSSDKFT